MAGRNDNASQLERTASQMSTASRKSGTVRAGSRKQSLVTPTSAKTLESFPSLSPDASPGPEPHDQMIASPVANLPTQSPSESLRKHPKQGPSIVQSLITSSPSFRGRSALFEDSPKGNVNDVPGALHHVSDEHIQRLVKKKGAVALVRQLAEDLADRDTEITLFRRRAEARERELKKMLREVEVSNLDIETRLHRIDNVEENTGLGLHGLPLNTTVKKAGGFENKSKVSGVTDGIDAMMGEAMKDNVGLLEIDEDYLDSLEDNDKQATLKARTAAPREPDVRSVTSSVDSQGRASSTLRGWKDYLWSGNSTSRKTSRASSIMSENELEVDRTTRARGSNGRKALNEDMFQPPVRKSTAQSDSTDTQSRGSSNSVASWTTKLFAGNSQVSQDSKNQGSIRARANTTGGDQKKPPPSRMSSSTFGPPPLTAKASLMRVTSMESTRAQKKAIQPLTLAPKSATKSSSQPSPAQTVASPTVADAARNLGPVEMDTIHPPESKPPTLAQKNDKVGGNDDLLTDRFGFIYDQRRRKREAEASISHRRGKSNASANVEMINSARESLKPRDHDQMSHGSMSDSQRPETPLSTEDRTDEKPTKRWQDYLKAPTFPTELLSHTPPARPATKVIVEGVPSPTLKRSPTTDDGQKSLPSISINPEPEVSSVTAANAEISKSSLNLSTPESATTVAEDEPVKMLLAHLTELHDNLQREKTVKWNEFLRKVRAERKKEGESAASIDPRSNQATMPEVTLTDGELIGVAGLGNKGKVGRAKWQEFKQLVLGGIAVAYRAKIWAECSGASALRVPGYYDDLVSSGVDDPSIVSQIQMDIHRTLTDNVFFRKGPGVSKLNEVLLAYSRRNPEVGYCQGMNLITASLLLIMPTAEDAFWVLTSMIENILPRHYYDHSLLASRADQQVLRSYVSEVLPKLSAHLDDLGIELEALTFQWFLSVFTDCLSAEALFRVWDVILCLNEGSTFLFQVALALLKLNETQLLECDSAASVYGYIGNEMTDHAISIDGLVSASEALKKVVRRSEVEERRWRAVEAERGRERGRGGSGSSGGTSANELSVEEPRPFEGFDG